jgi:histone-lysine N-methyltransferase EZH2
MPIIGGSFRPAVADAPAATGPSKKKKKLHWQNDDEIYDFVQAAHTSVMSLWNDKQKVLLQEHLKESLDPFLENTHEAARRKVYPRLLANQDDPADIVKELYCQPCDARNVTNECSSGDSKPAAGASMPSKNDDDDNMSASEDELTSDDDEVLAAKKASNKSKNKQNQFTVQMRGEKHRLLTNSIGPPNYLQATYGRLPPSSATIFLKTHYATEDEQNLKYVPYFGDDDKDDVVSDLYNLEDRQKQMEFGAEYEERTTNDILDEILKLIYEEQLEEETITPELNSAIHEALAAIMDEYQDRIHQRYELVILKNTPVVVAPPPPQKKKKLESYMDAMDTYRPLFCRRCFIYDCNMHSNLTKPSLQLQGELAVQRERDGFWENSEEQQGDNKKAASKSDTSSGDDIDTNDSTADDEDKKPAGTVGGSVTKSNIHDGVVADKTDITAKPGTESSQDEAKKLAAVDVTDTTADAGTEDTKDIPASAPGDLTLLQKAICERMFLIFQGDTKKMAPTMGAPEAVVAAFCRLKGYKLEPEFKILKDEHVQMFQKGKRKKRNFDQSMNNYNPTWLKRVDAAEIHPVFVPCDHELPCSETTCSCVQGAFFCTKHCVWERRSRNFFRGCACNGRCTTKSCSCFAAKRECDPDLCKQCGACTDPPNAPPTNNQRCRNDNIGMRRHAHLLLGKSQIEDAGWGIYNRHALKKGDYIHEYVGEVISQEEAERRGRIYDKVNRSYLFNLSSDYVVDASRKGNKTRFANHSNKPNSYARMVDVNGDIRIGLFAKEDIEPQTEIVFDYRYDVGMDNDLIIKPGMTVDWMKDPKMANRISKKYASGKESEQQLAAEDKKE